MWSRRSIKSLEEGSHERERVSISIYKSKKGLKFNTMVDVPVKSKEEVKFSKDAISYENEGKFKDHYKLVSRLGSGL